MDAKHRTKPEIQTAARLAAVTKAGGVVSARGFVVRPAPPHGQTLTDAHIAGDLARLTLRNFAGRQGADTMFRSAIAGSREPSHLAPQAGLAQHLMACLSAERELRNPSEFRFPHCAYFDPIYRGTSRFVFFPPRARAITLLREGEAPVVLLSPTVGFRDALILAQLCLSDAIIAYAVKIGFQPAPGDAALRLTRQIQGSAQSSASVAPPHFFTYYIGRNLWQGIARA